MTNHLPLRNKKMTDFNKAQRFLYGNILKITRKEKTSAAKVIIKHFPEISRTAANAILEDLYMAKKIDEMSDLL